MKNVVIRLPATIEIHGQIDAGESDPEDIAEAELAEIVAEFGGADVRPILSGSWRERFSPGKPKAKVHALLAGAGAARKARVDV